MIAIIDNYDSFTYNLVHYIEQFSPDYKVFRNDKINVSELAKYSKIVISPGPGMPDEVPLLNQIIESFAPVKPILGVCLGMQAIAAFYGSELSNLSHVLHGVKLQCSFNTDEDIFKNVKIPFEVGHYHSWIVDSDSLPPELEVIARGPDNTIMAIKHVKYPLYGVQFHPESVLTPQGILLIENWCKM